ncbi:MAG: Gfo/Idh/MocA family protein [Anaerolineae bacterium]
MDKITLAVVGCGDIAYRSYLPAMQEMKEQVAVVAACDMDRQRAERAVAEYGVEQDFTDMQEMLVKARPDGVLILTSMVPHGPLSLMAMEAGAHVYVEKVMAVNMEQADRMVELAERKGLILSCAPSTILLSAFEYTKKAIAAGEIGKVSLVQALGAHHGPARWDGYTSDPTWFYQQGAGPLFDLAVYPVQILTHVIGPVKRVAAFSGLAVPEVTMTAQAVRGQKVKVNVDDTVSLVLDFGNVTFASVNTSYNMLNSRLPAMQFFGDAGSLTAPQFLGDEVGLWHRGDKEWQISHLPQTLYDRLGVAAGLPHWIESIRTGRQPVNNGRHGRHVLEVLLAAQEAARSGCAVEIKTTF